MIDDDRRTFLKECAALAAVASAPLGTPQSLAKTSVNARRPAQRIAYVLMDETIDEARGFAAPLRARGATVLSVVETDLEELWRRKLHRACVEHSAIAGLTSHSTLFICAGFAREIGARVRHEAQHDCRGCDVLTHRLPAGTRSPALDDALAHAGAHWPLTLAAYIAALPATGVHLNAAVIHTETRRSATHPGTLFSWLIG